MMRASSRRSDTEVQAYRGVLPIHSFCPSSLLPRYKEAVVSVTGTTRELEQFGSSAPTYCANLLRQVLRHLCQCQRAMMRAKAAPHATCAVGGHCTMMAAADHRTPPTVPTLIHCPPLQLVGAPALTPAPALDSVHETRPVSPTATATGRRAGGPLYSAATGFFPIFELCKFCSACTTALVPQWTSELSNRTASEECAAYA